MNPSGGVMLAQDHCRALVQKYALGTWLGSAMPVPGLFMAVTAVETQLVMAIAKAYGAPLTRADAVKLFTFSGAKNVGIKAAGEASTVVPIVGSFVRPILYSASIKAFGDAVIKYFETLHPGREYTS